MPKFYIKSGQLKVTIVEKTALLAAKKGVALFLHERSFRDENDNLSLEDNIKLDSHISYNERGFESNYDGLLDTAEVLEMLGFIKDG